VLNSVVPPGNSLLREGWGGNVFMSL
jgi:hypothetical protein